MTIVGSEAPLDLTLLGQLETLHAAVQGRTL
jgi:hypothetical protein